MNTQEFNERRKLRRQNIYEATSNFSSAHAKPPLYRMRYLCLTNTVEDLGWSHVIPTEFVQFRSDLLTVPSVLWNFLHTPTYAKSLSYESYQGFREFNPADMNLGDSPEALMVKFSEFPYPKAVLFIATIAADIVYNLEPNTETHESYDEKWQEAWGYAIQIYTTTFGRMDEVTGAGLPFNFGHALETIGINTSSKYLDYVFHAYGFIDHVWYQCEYLNHELDPGFKLAQLPCDSEEEVH